MGTFGVPDQDPTSSPDGGVAGRPIEFCVEPDGGTSRDDLLPPGRLLRRASLVLKGVAPTDADYDALEAAGDDAAQRAFVDTFVDATLASPVFYESMFELARDWFNVPLVANDADEPEYGPRQQRVLTRCPADSAKATAYTYYRGENDRQAVGCDGSGARLMVEPWWAPGTTVELVGPSANTALTYTSNGVVLPCNGRPFEACGCGPHAIGCWYDPGTYPGWASYVWWNPQGQRRNLAEEPARLFAHLAWHDRPATDLILGTASVGSTDLQASLIAQALAGGFTSVLNDDSWWNPQRFAGARVDPLHSATDPAAWREYEVPARNPSYLADRAYKFDPRVQSGPMVGVPAAGALTTIGFMAAYPRERVRAARALETFACEVLAPPSAQAFNPYLSDPATEGPCQHCHRRIDPAAIHFKRFAKFGIAFEGWGATYALLGVGEQWHWPNFRSNNAAPFAHWNRWYQPGTRMTPVTAQRANESPESLFIDFLPSEQTLLGQTSDGTVGPLGFAKLIVASGAFDRCVVRHLHRQVLSRDIDPALEAGYLDTLTTHFVNQGRQIRPFVKALTQSDAFRRGL